MATDEQKAAAKEFLNWLVYSEIGQQMVVKTCSLIPPFKNNPNEPSDPLSRDIYEKYRTAEHSTHLRSCRTITGLSLVRQCRNIWPEEVTARN